MVHDCSQFAPCNQPNAVSVQQFSELAARKEIEIPLPPRGSPFLTVFGESSHFRIVKARMNIDLCNAGLKISYRLCVRLAPFIRRHTRPDINLVIDEDLV